MKKRGDRLQEIRDGQAQAVANRQKLLDRIKTGLNASKAAHDAVAAAALASSTRFQGFDVERAMSAATQLRLMHLEDSLGPATPLNRPTMFLLREFFQVLTGRTSASVLQWPSSQKDVSFLHPLAMLACLNAAASIQKSTGNFTWCDAACDFRTLYFPWRGGATSASHALLVRRTELLECNKYHLTRRHINSAGQKSLLDMLHETIGHMGGLSHRDGAKPHLAHPMLSELYPTFVAERGDGASRVFREAANELFCRIRFGASLHQMTDHRPSLCVPGEAPFAFFGVSDRIKPKHALTAAALSSPSGRPPDICLLDLCAPGLSRLGHPWADQVEAFIEEVQKHFPTLPLLAVTQDPFVNRRVSTMLRGSGPSKSPSSKVLVRTSRDPLSSDPDLENVSPTSVHFSTIAGPTADAIAALSDAARGTSDPILAGTLRREMGSLRKAASLPCGLAATYQFLEQEIGQAAAERFLEYRSSATLLAPLDEALRSEVAGAERERLSQARDAVAKAFETLDKETPIGSLLTDLAQTISRKSSRAIIAFSSGVDLVLGRYRLADDSEAGQALRRRFDNGHILLTSADNLADDLARLEKGKDRNTWKRLVLIAPSAEWLSVVCGRSWLPSELIVVCERTLASRVADTYQRLCRHPDLKGPGKLGERLANVAAAAKTEVEARGINSVDLDLEPRTFSAGSDALIDLTDEDSDDGSGALLLSLASGRKLKARPAQVIIRFNRNAEINPFERSSARDIRPKQTVVVPDNAFVVQARELLPLRVLAQSWLDVYHSTVEAHLPAIPGATLSAKARHLLPFVQSRGARTQSEAAVLGWLKVQEYKQLPPELRQPHAPQRRRDFNAFVSALSINKDLAEKMWMEGIQPLRIDRRRAGQKMAQAFVSVLVDPHGTASGFDAPVRHGIRTLRKSALEHLDQIIHVEAVE